MEFTSSAFEDGETIPTRYAGTGCGGDNVSPPLAWDLVPDGTESFAVLVEDPDAPKEGSFVHWVTYDIPADALGLPEGSSAGNGMHYNQGVNDYGNSRWDGPCPPAGNPHRYYFHLYALDVEELGLDPGASIEEVHGAMEGHIVEQEQLVGLFGR